MIKCVV